MKINVKHIAKLANLPLKEEEVEKFEKQLGETLTYIEHLKQVNTTDVIITSQVTGLENILDEDITRPSLSSEEVLSNAANEYNGFFKVPAILEE